MTLVSQRLPSAVQTRERPLDSPEGLKMLAGDSTLTLNKPVHCKLPGGGDFEESEIDLKKPGALSGGVLLPQREGCGAMGKSLAPR
jgi:hypothetical protein